jgi:antitoxin HicB
MVKIIDSIRVAVGEAVIVDRFEEEAMSAIYKLPLIFEEQPEGGYTVTCPILPELITEGDTIQEALVNANDALAAIIEGFEYLGKPLPSVLQPVTAHARFWVETAMVAP